MKTCPTCNATVKILIVNVQSGQKFCHKCSGSACPTFATSLYLRGGQAEFASKNTLDGYVGLPTGLYLNSEWLRFWEKGKKNWELVADEFAAAAGENRRTFDQARPVLLAALGGEPSDAAALWSHAVQDRGATIASGIGNCRPEQISVTREYGEGKVSEELIREAGVSALGILGRATSGPLRSLETPCTENWAGALHAENARCMLSVGGISKRKFRFSPLLGRIHEARPHSAIDLAAHAAQRPRSR